MDSSSGSQQPGTEPRQPPSRKFGSLWEAFEAAPLTTQFRVTTLIAVAATLLAILVVGAAWDVGSARSDAVNRAERTATALATRLTAGGSLSQLAVLEAHPEFLCATIRQPDGRVVQQYVRSDVAASASKPSALQWTARPSGVFHWVARTLALEPIYFDAPIPTNATARSTVSVVVDNGWVWHHALRRLALLPFALLIGAVVGWYASNALRRQVVEPLAQLAETTRPTGAPGSTSLGVEGESSQNELGRLARNFDRLSEKLAGYEREMNALRHSTAQKIVERTREFEMKARRADMQLKAKDEFLANMSHEIRTPMNGVMGMAELLAGTDLDKRQRRFVDSMRAAAETMMQIINDILDDSKIEAGKMELVQEPFDVRDLAESAGQLYAGRAEMKKLEMICRIEPTVPAVVLGDALRLRQVLGNLLSNAVKYTNEGEVEIRVGLDDLRGDRCRLHFSVRDTGPGIPDGDRSGVFEPFTQLKNAQRTGGTGLGLSIATRLVKLMGGERIDLRSQVGRGSTFSFAIPFEVREPAPVPDRANDEFSGMRVLVVDDNSTSYMLLEEMLSNWSVEVTVLGKARLVGDRMHDVATRGRPFDMVLLDHSLPDASTDELLRTIRLDPLVANTYVVLMSALDFNPSYEGTRAIVPDQFIAKPVRANLLRDALHRVRLPRHERDAASETGTVKAIVDSGPLPELGLRVLVVDDNAINREVAVAMLEEFRCRVDVAEDGGAAVESAIHHAYDAILMDCQMAGMDGYTATEKIRRNESNRNQAPTKIIALTANVLQRDRDRAMAVGMNGFLSKPFRAAQLNEILRPIAEQRGSLRELPPVMSAPYDETAARARPTAAARPSPLRETSAATAARGSTEPDLSDTVKSMPAWIEDEAEPSEILESAAFWSPASQEGTPSRQTPASTTSAPAQEPVDTSASSSRLPLLDLEQVEAIRGINKPQLFERMCQMLFDASKDNFQRLDAALAAGKHEEIAAAAHALKSPVNNLGGRRLGELLERCETAALGGADLAVLRRNAAGLKAHFAALTAALQSEMKRGQGR